MHSTREKFHPASVELFFIMLVRKNSLWHSAEGSLHVLFSSGSLVLSVVDYVWSFSGASFSVPAIAGRHSQQPTRQQKDDSWPENQAVKWRTILTRPWRYVLPRPGWVTSWGDEIFRLHDGHPSYGVSQSSQRIGNAGPCKSCTSLLW